ncbi:hypothetical protein A2U01_0084499, partial [Trifolium medium]|nr:hypothetical protein [Trifolium medium]
KCFGLVSSIVLIGVEHDSGVEHSSHRRRVRTSSTVLIGVVLGRRAQSS